MTDKRTIELSRRNLLAAMGAIGGAAALGGAGTMAYFNDTESFTGNQLVAGELDLKVDWQETYDGPNGEEYVSAFPDTNGDNVQDEVLTRDEIAQDQFGDDYANLSADNQATVEADFRAQFADVPDQLQAPLIDLQDVKPGDSGEVTFSMHVFDNPAYLWMGGNLYENAENGMNEPEGQVDTTPGGDLADALMARLWYDEDGDNVFDMTGSEGTPLEVALVSDVSGSMSGSNLTALKSAATNFVDNLSQPDEGAAISFASGASVDVGLTTTYQDIKDAINGYSAGGTTNMSAGISAAENELLNGTNATSGASKVMILLSDGYPDSTSNATAAANSAKGSGIRLITIALGSGAGTSFLAGIASSPSDAFVAPQPADLDSIYASIAQLILTGEQEIASGSLRHVLGALNAGVALDGDRLAEGRQCYPNSTTQYLGFEWWVPTDVGNEIQTDSVAFDMSFYAEQCRHNDGENNPFLETSTGTGWATMDTAWIAKARYGDNIPTAGAYELEVGTGPGDRDEENAGFTSGQTEPFSLVYDAVAGEATFAIAGKSVTHAVPGANGKLFVTAKPPADGQVDVENVTLNGQDVGSPDGVSATDGTYMHLTIDGANLQNGFSLSGEATFTWAGTTANELPSFQVDVENN